MKIPKILPLALAGFACAVVLTGAAQKNPSAQTKKAKDQLDQAQEKLKDARKQLDKAQSEFNDAQRDQQAAATGLQHARRTAIDRVGPKFGLPAAQAVADEARQAVAAGRDKVLAQLKARPDYQTAVSAADEAREKFSKINGDTSIPDEQRAKLLAEATAVVRSPAEMQKAAEQADPPLQSAQRAAHSATEQAAAITAKVEKEIADDPELKDALAKSKDAVTRLAKARDALAREQKQFDAAQAAVNREQQQYQQAQKSDAKKTKKGKN